MKRKEDTSGLYKEWIRRRRSVPVPDAFAKRVMGEISARQAPPPRELAPFYRIISSPPARWAAAAGALLLGLFRLSYITGALLIP